MNIYRRKFPKRAIHKIYWQFEGWKVSKFYEICCLYEGGEGQKIIKKYVLLSVTNLPYPSQSVLSKCTIFSVRNRRKYKEKETYLTPHVSDF